MQKRSPPQKAGPLSVFSNSGTTSSFGARQACFFFGSEEDSGVLLERSLAFAMRRLVSKSRRLCSNSLSCAPSHNTTHPSRSSMSAADGWGLRGSGVG